jgi:PAS domain S-box-containing protein
MKTKILIVDDKEENLYLLESLLQGYGYTVTSTINGEEALESAINNPPDLIISDILMPVMDGFTLCKKWKAHDLLKNIPFVFYTATYTDPKDEVFALRIGADRFILKPSDPDTFIEIIKDVLITIEKNNTHPHELIDESETIVLKEYNEVLVRKLEKKINDTEIALIELWKSKEKYKAVISCASDAIISVNSESIITSFNESATRMFNYKEKDIIGQPISTIIPQHLIEEREEMDLKVMKDKYLKSFETDRMRRDGSLFPAEVSLGLMKDEGKERIGIVGIIRDITQRKESEKKILDQLDELRRWQNIFLGREGRVLELKKEVNELLEKLGEPKKYDKQ